MTITLEALLVWLIVGALAGWLAGFLARGAGYGCIGNIALGLVGAVVGGFLLDALNVTITTGNTLINAVFTSMLGALTIILIGRALRR